MKPRRPKPLTCMALPLLAVLLGLTTVASAQPGIISTVAGTAPGGFNGDGILATTALLRNVFDVSVDGSGNIFIADRNKYPSINISAFLMASRCMELGVGHRSIVISHP